MSFCSCKDLKRLSETCTRFRDILATNIELMRKLTFVVRLDLDYYDDRAFENNMKAIEQCIENRCYTSLKLFCQKLPENTARKSTGGSARNRIGIRDIIKKIVSMADKLQSMEHLMLIGGSTRFTPMDFEKLTRVFLPQLKSLHFDNSLIYPIEEDMDRWMEIEELKSDSLEKLSIAGKNGLFFIDFFLECKNVKWLTLNVPDVKHFSQDFYETSVWQLQHIEIHGNISLSDKNFLKFLKRQKYLKEFTHVFDLNGYSYRYVFNEQGNILNALLNLLSLKTTHVTTGIRGMKGGLDLSNVEPQLLGSIKHFGKFSSSELKLKAFDLKYAPAFIQNVKAFENSLMEFLSDDSRMRGVKYSRMVKSFTIGQPYWIEAGVVLSEKFIRDLIAKLPRLTRIELYSASSVDDVSRTIKASGRNFKEIKIFGKDGESSRTYK